MSCKPFSWLSNYFCDQRGVISILAVAVILLALGITTLVIDAGSILLARRQLQNAADAAALAAAQHIENASMVATSSLVTNGYDASALISAQTGIYTADEELEPIARFVPDATSNANAVQVDASAEARTFFARIFGAAPFSTIEVQAIAAKTPMIAFSAGTRQASLQAGIVNDLLGQLTGSTISLSAIDYQAMALTSINAADFLNALAVRANVTSGNYQALLESEISIGEFLDATIDVLQKEGGAIGDAGAALLAIQQIGSAIPLASSLTISNILSIPSWATIDVGNLTQNQSSDVNLNIFTLMSAMAQLLGVEHVIDLGSSVTVPVTHTSIRTRLVIGQPMQYVAIGEVGTEIRTAQLRLAVDMTLANISLPRVLSSTLSLPILAEVAPGTATVTELPCNGDGIMAVLHATSGASTLRLASVADVEMADFSTVIPAETINLINLGVLGIPVVRVSVNGSVAIAPGAGDLSFSESDIESRTIKSINGNSHVFEYLGDALTLSTTVLNSALLSALTSSLSGTLNSLLNLLTNALGGLDGTMNDVLSTLGIQLGVIDVVVTGERCGVPKLVG